MLPPPPKGQVGLTLDQLPKSALPPPPKGQTGLTLEQINAPAPVAPKLNFFNSTGISDRFEDPNTFIGEAVQKRSQNIVDIQNNPANVTTPSLMQRLGQRVQNPLLKRGINAVDTAASSGAFGSVAKSLQGIDRVVNTEGYKKGAQTFAQVVRGGFVDPATIVAQRGINAGLSALPGVSAPMEGAEDALRQFNGNNLMSPIMQNAASVAAPVIQQAKQTSAFKNVVDPLLALGEAATSLEGGMGLQKPLNRSVDFAKQAGNAAIDYNKVRRGKNAINMNLETLIDVEAGNSKTRKLQIKNESQNNPVRQMTVESGYLDNGATDSNGNVLTQQKGGAVEMVQTQRIDPVEQTVMDAARADGTLVPTEVVIAKLKAKLSRNGGVVGASLNSAQNRLSSEIKGLMIKANKMGHTDPNFIPVEILQDAKIGKSKKANYVDVDANTIQKAEASAYQELVEDYVTSIDVKSVNRELQLQYAMKEYIAALHGLKLPSGRLGIYGAKAGGALMGSALGSVFGPAGTATGAYLGGEAGGAIKRMQFRNKFKKVPTNDYKQSGVLTEAQEAIKAKKLQNMKDKFVPKQPPLLQLPEGRTKGR